MNELNQTLSAIRRQKKVYLKLLDENPSDTSLQEKIDILNEEEKEYLGKFEDLKDVL